MTETSCCKLPFSGENHNPIKQHEGFSQCLNCHAVIDFKFGKYVGPGGQEVVIKKDYSEPPEREAEGELWVELFTTLSPIPSNLPVEEAAYLVRGFRYKEEGFAAEVF